MAQFNSKRSVKLRSSARFTRFHPELEALESRTLLDAGLTSLAAGYDPSHVLVQFEAGYDPRGLLPKGATLGEQLPLVQNLYVVDLPAGWSVPQMLSAIQKSPHILLAQPDYQLTVSQTPNDPSFSSQWGLNNTSVPTASINATTAWDTTTGTGKITVAVIDTGVDYNHPDLYLNDWINQAEIPNQWNAGPTLGTVVSKSQLKDVDGDGRITFRDLNDAANAGLVNDVNGDGRIDAGDILAPLAQGGWADGKDNNGDGYVDDLVGWNFVSNTNDPMDDNSHGTHCAGIIGAVGNNGVGVSGVIWDVQIMAMKFMDASGSGSTSNAIKALNYAVAHGAEISSNSWGGAGFNSALNDAINNARAAGHIFVAAAGNSGANNDSSPFYPSGYTQDNVVAVAATDSNDNLAGYSNYGANSVDLAAPGSSIYSTVPVSMGSYAYKSGTSMATPFVAGALALVWDAHPDWTYKQVIDQVLGTVDQIPSLAGKVATGGRLDLANALGAPVGSPQTPAPLPSLSINNVSVTEGNSGTKTATFTVTLSAASAQAVTVNYMTADGSATAGSDYVSTSGTLTFAAGETSKTISVVIYGDTTVEPNETFTVNLSNATNATIGTSQGVGTILNDDTQSVTPGISVNNVSVNEGNNGVTFATFTVTLSQASNSSVSVKYATANGTATAGSDYTAASGTLTFSAGVTSMTVKVKIKGDTLVEPNETFYLVLSSPTNATLVVSQGTGTIVNDDGLGGASVADLSGRSGVGATSTSFSTTDWSFTVTGTQQGPAWSPPSSKGSTPSTGTVQLAAASSGDARDPILQDAFWLL